MFFSEEKDPDTSIRSYLYLLNICWNYSPEKLKVYYFQLSEFWFFSDTNKILEKLFNDFPDLYYKDFLTGVNIVNLTIGLNSQNTGLM